MFLNYMFKSPYLDEDSGANLGGGGIPADTIGQQTDTQTTDTTVQTGQQQTQQEQMFKLKYNHEEREIPYSQAVELAQKGMNYDKGIERARQEAAQQARDSWIAEQGYAWHDKPIKTEAEYKQALQEQELENKIRQQYSNVPDEIVNELVESKRFREETIAEKKAREEKDSTSKMYSEFLEAYPEVKPAEIPPQVWQDVKGGRNLLDAYARYENKQLKEKLAGVQTQQQTAQANEKNAAASTGSAKGTGIPNTFFTKEQVSKMSTEEVRKNYKQICESTSKW